MPPTDDRARPPERPADPAAAAATTTTATTPALAPEVSVVVPTHGGPFLAATVASVAAQSVTNWELIIVDDGSRDGTAAVAASLAAGDRRVRVITQDNRGIAAARNRGIASIAASARYVALLDHDDLWMPETLARLTAELRRRPSASAAHGQAVCIDEAGAPVIIGGQARFPGQRWGMRAGKRALWPDDRPTELANLVYEDCIVSVGSALIRRAALDRVGGLDPRAETADDYDLWLRLARHGEIAFVPEVVLSYRVHGGRTSARGRPSPRGRGVPYVQYKLATAPDSSPAERRLAAAGFRAYQVTALRGRLRAAAAALCGRRYRAFAREVAVLGKLVAAYLRGRPARWHR